MSNCDWKKTYAHMSETWITLIDRRLFKSIKHHVHHLMKSEFNSYKLENGVSSFCFSFSLSNFGILYISPRTKSRSIHTSKIKSYTQTLIHHEHFCPLTIFTLPYCFGERDTDFVSLAKPKKEKKWKNKPKMMDKK